MRTETEIKAKIDEVQADRDKLPEFSFFGNANWRMMDFELETLRAALDGKVTDADCRDRKDELFDDQDEAFEDGDHGGSEHEFITSQIRVYDWLDGTIDY